MRWFIVAFVFLNFESVFGQDQAISIKAAGVTLIWEKIDEDAFDHVSILHSQKPVAVTLYLKSEAKKIVSIDRKGSKLSSLTDDQGTKMKGRIGHFPDIAKNGSGAFVDVEGETYISSKAQRLILKGTIHVALASKTNAKRSKVVPARKGSKLILADDLVFEVENAGKDDFREGRFGITLKIDRDIPMVAKVRFFDGDGKQIDAKSEGSGRMGFGRRVTVTRDFSLERSAKEISIEVDLWADLKEVDVSFDLTIGVGGGK
jgi:hypothetical protein